MIIIYFFGKGFIRNGVNLGGGMGLVIAVDKDGLYFMGIIV